MMFVVGDLKIRKISDETTDDFCHTFAGLSKH